MDAIKFLKQLVQEIEKMENSGQVDTEKQEKQEKPEITLTEQQKMAIRGRIAEGLKWGVRNKEETLIFFCSEKPKKCKSYDYLLANGDYSFVSNHEFYNFITPENSPLYLPYLLDE